MTRSTVRNGSVALALFLAGALLGRADAQETSPLYDIPELSGIAIDGVAADWKDDGFQAGPLLTLDKQIRPPSDYDCRFRLGWDEGGLLFLGIVRDENVREAAGIAELGSRDAVELFVGTKRGEPDFYQAQISPGADPAYGKARFYIHDYRADKQTVPELTVEAAGKATDDGYVLEARLPWTNLAIRAEAGTEIAVQVWMTDSDHPGDWFRTLWYPEGYRGPRVTSNMHRVRLARWASPDESVVLSGSYERFRRTRIGVYADRDLAGRVVRIMEKTKTLLTQRLSLVDGSRSEARFVLPLPPPGETPPELTVRVAGDYAGIIRMPDTPDSLRAKALRDKGPVFKPCVFDGPMFPPCDFEQPSLVDDLLGGAYRIETSFRDASGETVETADQPGRYGAIVDVVPENGRSLRFFRTLYRTAGKVDWWDKAGDVVFPLPDGLGLDAAAVEIAGDRMGYRVADAWLDSLSRGNSFAVYLAAVAEKALRMPYEDWGDAAGVQDRRWWVSVKRKLYGWDSRWPKPFECPRPAQGEPAREVREGSLEEAGMVSNAVEQIDAVLGEWAADTDEAFAVCIVRRGVVVLHKAYGMRGDESMTVDTRSWMASITKTMSSSLMWMMLDQGLVALDDPVAQYLPPLAGIEVPTPLTIKHLYTHTNGLWGHWGDWRHDLAEYIAFLYPQLAVGQRYEYNGVGFAIGGKIIEAISGESIPDFYQKHLLGPLGCTNTVVRGTSGDASSVPLDMAKFGQMLLNRGAYGKWRFFSEETFGRILPARLTDLLGDETKVSSGIGIMPSGGSGLSTNTIGHGAASAATFRVDPDNELVVVMTRNRGGKNHAKYHGRFLEAVTSAMVE